MTTIRIWLGPTETDMLMELKEFFDKQENVDLAAKPLLDVGVKGRKRRIRRIKITNSFIIRNAISTLYFETLSVLKEKDTKGCL